MSGRRGVLLALFAVFVLAALAIYIFRPLTEYALLGEPAPYSEQAFAAWLEGDTSAVEDFTAFETMLLDNGVREVVPAWQLTRADSGSRGSCDHPGFLIPPRKDWPNIVPVLKLVRDEVKPRIGDVEVVSSYRTQEFNGCIGGATQSRHLSFHALDMIALERDDNRALFAELCALQQELGPQSRLGLGAYFDPEAPLRNSRGRFHLDLTGYRS